MSDKKPTYNHLFSISFSVENESPDGQVTGAELYAAMVKRISGLTNPDPMRESLIEACGPAEDTYECK